MERRAEKDTKSERVERTAEAPAAAAVSPITEVGPTWTNRALLSLMRGAGAARPSAMAVRRAAKPGATAPQRLPGWIVEDDAAELAPGQMTRSAFLAELADELYSVSRELLRGSNQCPEDCPILNQWFRYYGRQRASVVERTILEFVPAAVGVGSARAYISIVSARVRRGIELWLQTGEIDDEGARGAAARAMGEEPEPARITDSLGAGEPLRPDVRARMENAMGEDFSDVRVHTDSGAAAMSRDLGARAFTIGRHVAFGADEFRPGNPVGDALIAHELAHTVQQLSGPLSADRVASSESALERDADQAAAGAVTSIWGRAWNGLTNIGARAISALRSGVRMQRCTPPTVVPTAPLDTHRLQVLCAARGVGTTTTGVVRNREIGAAFEGAILRSTGFSKNTTAFTSAARAARTGGTGIVIPDLVITIGSIGGGLLARARTFPQSEFVEIKAVNGSLAQSYSNYQLYGMIDWLGTHSAAATATGVVPPPTLLLITTSNTTVSPTLISWANTKSVSIWQSIALEVPDPSGRPDLSRIGFGMPLPLNTPPVTGGRGWVAGFLPAVPSTPVFINPGYVPPATDPDQPELTP